MELNDIEHKIAGGKITPAQVFTQMKQHIPSTALPKNVESVIAAAKQVRLNLAEMPGTVQSTVDYNGWLTELRNTIDALG